MGSEEGRGKPAFFCVSAAAIKDLEYLKDVTALERHDVITPPASGFSK